MSTQKIKQFQNITVHKTKVKPPKCPSIDEWINKTWYIHTTEYITQ